MNFTALMMIMMTLKAAAVVLDTDGLPD